LCLKWTGPLSILTWRTLMIMPTCSWNAKGTWWISKRIRYRKMYSCLTKQVMLFLLSTPVPRPSSTSFRWRQL
jgi:hypothetical protein